MLRIPQTLAVAAVALAAPAAAQTDAAFAPEWSLTAGASTLGATVEPSVRMKRHWGLRMPVGDMSFDFDQDSNGETFSGTLDGGGFAPMIDYFPTGGAVHLSAGLAMTTYSAHLTATNVTIGPLSSDISVAISQKRDINPILALGYHGQIWGGLTLSASAGAIVTSGFNVSATESAGILTQTDVSARTAEIRDAADNIDAIPFAKVTLGWRF